MGAGGSKTNYVSDQAQFQIAHIIVALPAFRQYHSFYNCFFISTLPLIIMYVY